MEPLIWVCWEQQQGMESSLIPAGAMTAPNAALQLMKIPACCLGSASARFSHYPHHRPQQEDSRGSSVLKPSLWPGCGMPAERPLCGCGAWLHSDQCLQEESLRTPPVYQRWTALVEAQARQRLQTLQHPHCRAAPELLIYQLAR